MSSIIGSVVCANDAEAQARLRKANAIFVKVGKGGVRAYKHTSGLRWVMAETLPGGRVKLTESTQCEC